MWEAAAHASPKPSSVERSRDRSGSRRFVRRRAPVCECVLDWNATSAEGRGPTAGVAARGEDCSLFYSSAHRQVATARAPCAAPRARPRAVRSAWPRPIVPCAVFRSHRSLGDLHAVVRAGPLYDDRKPTDTWRARRRSAPDEDAWPAVPSLELLWSVRLARSGPPRGPDRRAWSGGGAATKPCAGT